MSNNKYNKWHLIAQAILWGCFSLAAGLLERADNRFLIVVILLPVGLVSFFIWDYTNKANNSDTKKP